MLSGDIVGNRESTRDCLDRCDAGPFVFIVLLGYASNFPR